MLIMAPYYTRLLDTKAWLVAWSYGKRRNYILPFISIFRGKTLVSGNADSFVKIWDIDTGNYLRSSFSFLWDHFRPSCENIGRQKQAQLGRYFPPILWQVHYHFVGWWNGEIVECGDWRMDSRFGLVGYEKYRRRCLENQGLWDEACLRRRIAKWNRVDQITRPQFWWFSAFKAIYDDPKVNALFQLTFYHFSSALPGTSANLDPATINFNSLGHVNPT